MLDDLQYRTTEKYLYSYRFDKMRLKQANDEYKILRERTDIHVQKYVPSYPSEGSYSDPVSEYCQKIFAYRKIIKRLKKRINTVKKLNSDLNAGQFGEHSYIMQKILKNIFLRGMSKYIFCKEYKLSSRTFYRRKRELVNIAVKYFEL